VTDDEPLVLVLGPDAPAKRPRRPEAASHEALPSGPLELGHRTLEMGLRAWVEAQTRARLGYVEQLYTFGDRDRAAADGSRVLSIGYLALGREASAPAMAGAIWRSWYRYFPWEDWRRGRPAALDRVVRQLARWADAAPAAGRAARRERVADCFGADDAWSEERALERYELLYEVGLAPEAHRDGIRVWAKLADAPAAEPMQSDHRRILATAIGRLRGKIKYRPLVFELMPPAFTFLQLQRAVEALAGVRLHKQNFRRLVVQQGLVEETGRIVTATGGRPAREIRFRQDAIQERLVPALRLPVAR